MFGHKRHVAFPVCVHIVQSWINKLFGFCKKFHIIEFEKVVAVCEFPVSNINISTARYVRLRYVRSLAPSHVAFPALAVGVPTTHISCLGVPVSVDLVLVLNEKGPHFQI